MKKVLFFLLLAVLLAGCTSAPPNNEETTIETESPPENNTSFYDSLPFTVEFENYEMPVDGCYFIPNSSGYDAVITIDLSELPSSSKENLSDTYIGYFLRPANGEMLPSSYTKQFDRKIYIEYTLSEIPSSCIFSFMFDSRVYFECDSPSEYIVDYSSLPEDVQQMYLRNYSDTPMRVINITEIQEYINKQLEDPANPCLWSSEAISEVGTDVWQKLCSTYEEDVFSSAAEFFDLSLTEIEEYYFMQFSE